MADAKIDKAIADLLKSGGLDPAEVVRTIKIALDEDLRYGPDVTTDATARPDATVVADVVARQAGVVAGLPVALAVLNAAGMQQLDSVVLKSDGDRVKSGDTLIEIKGSLRRILSAERTLLNFITHLSGIATSTREWVDAVAGTDCVIRDTRKTTPGIRTLEKYAVRCGGGSNHRMGLGDAALIKDNHVLAAGGITEAIEAVRHTDPDIPLEVECDTTSQVREALKMNVKLILLDNMSLSDIKASVALGRDYRHTRFEASGGIKLEKARAVAQTGVHFIAIGAITHSIPALDLALDIRG